MPDSSLSKRRDFLKTSATGAAVLGLGLSTFGPLVRNAIAADDAEVSKPGMPKPVTNEALYRMGAIGPVELSKAASKIGVDKATERFTKEFAGFELTETIALSDVLTNLGTPVPPPDAMYQEVLAKLNAASKGSEFDKAFITAQLETHEFLRDLAQDYLSHPREKGNAAEEQTQHLATLALATIKEHVIICQRILGDMKA